MAALYADENFPVQVVERLRKLGHDVLTAPEAGQAGDAIKDNDVLQFATLARRALLTLNRWDFVALHRSSSNHAGIIVCSVDTDVEGQSHRIHDAIQSAGALAGKLLRVNRPPR